MPRSRSCATCAVRFVREERRFELDLMASMDGNVMVKIMWERVWRGRGRARARGDESSSCEI